LPKIVAVPTAKFRRVEERWWGITVKGGKKAACRVEEEIGCKGKSRVRKEGVGRG